MAIYGRRLDTRFRDITTIIVIAKNVNILKNIVSEKYTKDINPRNAQKLLDGHGSHHLKC
jgi:hypothetical protein